MQLHNPSPSDSGESSKHPLSPSQTTEQQDQPDMFLQLLQGPVMSLCVGSGHSSATYNVPMALFCHHSQFFRQEISRYQAMGAHITGSKKRKQSYEVETMTVQIKVEESERLAQSVSLNDSLYDKGEVRVKLPDVDPFIFGLFLKYVYAGSYSTVVDVRPGTPRSISRSTMLKQPDTPHASARASMPPPANISSRPTPPTKSLPYLSLLASSSSTLSLQESSRHFPTPPSFHAYLLSVRFGASGFLNHTIHHIYYGIGKYFVLDPSLVHYVWSNTLPHPFCSSSPLRKLILDVMTVHWSSTSTHIVAKQPALHKSWNEVLDMHRDLRHEFTMGLQGVRKVLPVQAYFVATCGPSAPAREKAKALESRDLGISIAESVPKVHLSADAAAADTTVTKNQDNDEGEEQKK